MADAYVGEIRIFAGNFAPKGWALCNGQLLPIAQNSALFAIIGVQYGGDGKTTFALPNLMGKAAMHQGQGQGLSNRMVGQQVGTPTVTLLQSEMPAHTHTSQAVNAVGNLNEAQGNIWGQAKPPSRTSPQPNLFAAQPNVTMSPIALAPAGSSMPHNNMQPFIAQNFIICLDGEFPSRG